MDPTYFTCFKNHPKELSAGVLHSKHNWKKNESDVILKRMEDDQVSFLWSLWQFKCQVMKTENALEVKAHTEGAENGGNIS